jgi:hypothetical protein
VEEERMRRREKEMCGRWGGRRARGLKVRSERAKKLSKGPRHTGLFTTLVGWTVNAGLLVVHVS